MSNDPEEIIEGGAVTATKPSDQLVRETNDGKNDLVDEQQEQLRQLKAGGKSGITEEFGKPMLVQDAAASGDENGGPKESFMGDVGNVFSNIGQALEQGEHAVADAVGSAVAGAGHAIVEAEHAVADGVGWLVGGIGNLFHGAEAPAKPPEAPKPPDVPPPVSPEVAPVTPVAPTDSVKPGNENFNPLDVVDPPPDVPGPPVYMDPLVDTAKPPYAGEDIRVDFKPSMVTAKAGDTLESLAAKQLPSASSDQRQAYVKEIATVNGLDPEKPGSLESKQLKLPGGTADGAMVIRDENSRIITRSKNGVENTKDPGGREYTRKPDGKGGYVETHSGPRLEDQYELALKDGKLLLADKPGDKPREVPAASEEVKAERQKLWDLSREKITDPEKRSKYDADMLRFEERAAKQDPPLAGSEIAKVYKEQERLLTATGDTPLTQDDRLKIAEQSMSQCASPKSIDQGQHATCNMTTVESTLYTRSPSDAMKVVADIALTGEYTAKDGSNVKVDPTAADTEAKNNPPLDGQRSQASQIFQVAAVNLYYQKNSLLYMDGDNNLQVALPGNIEFKELPQKPGAIPPVASGDRLIDHSTTPPVTIMQNWKDGVPLTSPNLDDRALVDVPNMITGRKDAVLLENEHGTFRDHTGAVVFKSEEEMVADLTKAKDGKKFPVILAVHAGQEPFLHDSGNGAAGGSGGWHVVTVTDFDEATGKVQLDNQWGSAADHQGDKAVSAHDLFRATHAPDLNETVDGKKVNVTIADLQKDVDSNRANHTVDTAKELELLRVKKQYGDMKDEDFEKDLKQTIVECTDQWDKQKAAGTLNKDEYDSTKAKIQDMTLALPADKRVDFVELMHDKGLLDDKLRRNALLLTVDKFFGAKHTDDEADKFMEKTKTLYDSISPDLQKGFYETASKLAPPLARIDMAQYERKQNLITDDQYDQLLVDATVGITAGTTTKADATAYGELLQKTLSGFSEDRRNAVLSKVKAKLAPPKK